MNGVEPIDQLRGVRWLERDVMCGKLARRSLEPLFDGFVADQERAGNFGHSETAQGLEREGKLVFARQKRMAARKNHPELAIFNRGVQKQIVDAGVRRWADGGPCLGGSGASIMAPQGGQDLVVGDAMNPGRGIGRNPAHAPRLERFQERGLDHFLDEIKVAEAEETS
jgi:hypothetical protein